MKTLPNDCMKVDSGVLLYLINLEVNSHSWNLLVRDTGSSSNL